jgi:hypothetical protein
MTDAKTTKVRGLSEENRTYLKGFYMVGGYFCDIENYGGFFCKMTMTVLG